MSDRRQSWFASLSTLLVTGAISLVALEIGFRYYLFGPDGFLTRKPASIVDIGVSGLIQLSDEPGVIYEFKPNIVDYYYLADLHTNSVGLRDTEHTLRKPRGTYRVAVLGDSYTMPLGVELHASYHSLLESRLNATHTDVRYEFINFGVPGYSLRQYVNVLKHKAMAYDLDAVLVGFCYPNDFHVPPEDKATEPFAIRPKETRSTRSFAYEQFELLFNRLADKLSSRFGQQAGQNAADLHETGCDPADAAYMKSMFSELRELTAPKAIPVIVAGLELVEPRGACAELVEELVGNEGLYFVNAAGITTLAESQGYRIYPLDAHPNARAHEAFAERIIRFLESQQLLLPESSADRVSR